MREKIYSVLAAGRWRKHLDRLNTKLLAARQVSARQLTAAGLVLYHPTEAHIRFNVAFSQQPRLAEYLHERLQSLAGARAALARVT